jgi:hypothetical protein
MKAYKLKEKKFISRLIALPCILTEIKKNHKIVFASEPLQAGKSELKLFQITAEGGESR